MHAPAVPISPRSLSATAAGIPTGTSQNAPIFVGLGLIALGSLALWYRKDLFLVCQWFVRYPDHGPLYLLIQIVIPVIVLAVGILLVVSPLFG